MRWQYVIIYISMFGLIAYIARLQFLKWLAVRDERIEKEREKRYEKTYRDFNNRK